MKEQDFFREVIKTCKSNKELTLIYNRIMGTNLSTDTIRKRANKYGYHIKDNIGTNDLRSQEHLEWIESNKDKYETTTELHKAYQEHFNSNVKHASFVYILKNVIKSKNKIEYTEEETQWFKDNVHNFYSRLQVKYAFNKEFNKNLTIDEINHKIGYMKLHCSRPPKKIKKPKPKVEKTKEEKQKIKEKRLKNLKNTSMFSLEQQEWLKNNVSKYNFYIELYDEFQKVFDTPFTLKQIKQWSHNHSLKLKKFYKYNEQERKWLFEHYDSELSYTELVSEFERIFNKKIKPATLKNICNSNNVFKNKENYACNVPTLPVGTEKIFNNRLYVKISNKKGNRDKKSYHENWVEKPRYIWEQANGPIPKGYYLCFRDGNKLNCELSNLYLATHSERGLLAKNKVYGYEEYTEAYLDIIRLEKELLNFK